LSIFTLRASVLPSAERIVPRLMRSSASSGRRLAVLSRRSWAANTLHHEVANTSTPNSSAKNA
jgi:hypothetical protein